MSHLGFRPPEITLGNLFMAKISISLTLLLEQLEPGPYQALTSRRDFKSFERLKRFPLTSVRIAEVLREILDASFGGGVLVQGVTEGGKFPD